MLYFFFFFRERKRKKKQSGRGKKRAGTGSNRRTRKKRVICETLWTRTAGDGSVSADFFVPTTWLERLHSPTLNLVPRARAISVSGDPWCWPKGWHCQRVWRSRGDQMKTRVPCSGREGKHIWHICWRDSINRNVFIDPLFCFYCKLYSDTYKFFIYF